MKPKFDFRVASPENFCRDISQMPEKEGKFRMKYLGEDLIRGIFTAQGSSPEEVEQKVNAYSTIRDITQQATELMDLLNKYDAMMGNAPAAAPAPASAPMPERTPVHSQAQPAPAPAPAPAAEEPPKRTPRTTKATPAEGAVGIDPEFLRKMIKEELAGVIGELKEQGDLLSKLTKTVATPGDVQQSVAQLDTAIRLVAALCLFLGENELRLPRPELAKLALSDMSAINELLGKGKKG